VKYSKYSFT